MTQQDDYLVDAILCHAELAEQGEALALAQDTIRIALKAAGHENVDNMSQFERASALLDMAQEIAANDEKEHEEREAQARVFDNILNTHKPSIDWANGRGYNGKVYKEIAA